jgi:hypothetical protein
MFDTFVNAITSMTNVNNNIFNQLVEEIVVPVENHRPVASHEQTLPHNRKHIAMNEVRTHNFTGDRH